MKVKKTELMIIYHSENSYGVSIRKKIFWFIKKWAPITCQESENSKEVPMEFRSFKEANDFIETIAE